MEMRLNSREDMEIKQEDNKDHNQTTSLYSLRQNPRIVRVSRAFGGKDRHSKVFTVRGLRDRRIRLSAVTAIQLYDLQERLGLSQPSKVIDWLLEAAKNDVDLLPPLHFPPNLTGAGECFPGIFQSFDLGSCSSRTGDNLDLEKGKFDQRSNLDHGFDINHHFSNSIQSSKICFPTSFSSSSYHYSLGHLQQSLLDQSGNNVTVAFSNNNLNSPAPESMSSIFPRYPTFLGGDQLQLFSSNSNSLKQTDHGE
ncbi:unnamed protein product [Arabis nemorensis]|uniref:TCP domain-containing protein n=1 Tax=Arabis nemorensis TaxID=586526 RepID=A0A565CJ65_9BRAS|nr:unnamed protein product [Arabis nemorensis]